MTPVKIFSAREFPKLFITISPYTFISQIDIVLKESSRNMATENCILQLALALPERTTQNRFYARAVVMVALLNKIDPTLTWKRELKNLLAKYNMINPAELGFPTGWNASQFWQ
jgi:hypothetical protein